MRRETAVELRALVEERRGVYRIAGERIPSRSMETGGER
jgi:hypothetical protein